MHFTYEADNQFFIDYMGKKLYLVDKRIGEIQDLEVFVCVLGSSQYTYVEARESQRNMGTPQQKSICPHIFSL